MALSCIISEIKQDIDQKITIFSHRLHLTPPLGGPRRSISIPFGVEKLEWCGYLIYLAVSIVTDEHAILHLCNTPRGEL